MLTKLHGSVELANERVMEAIVVGASQLSGSDANRVVCSPGLTRCCRLILPPLSSPLITIGLRSVVQKSDAAIFIGYAFRDRSTSTRSYLSSDRLTFLSTYLTRKFILPPKTPSVEMPFTLAVDLRHTSVEVHYVLHDCAGASCSPRSTGRYDLAKLTAMYYSKAFVQLSDRIASLGRDLPPWTEGSAHHLAARRRTAV